MAAPLKTTLDTKIETLPYKGFVVQVTKQDKTKAWIRNDQAIRNTLKCSGMFVLRSSVESAPIAALKTYRMRETVENDFEQFKNWVDGDRLRCTEKNYLGKLFVCTLATSLRLMIMHQAHVNEKTLNMKIPNNSMDVLFGKLRLIEAEKRKDANAWVVRQLAKKAARIIRAAWIRVASESPQITDMDQLSGSFGQTSASGLQSRSRAINRQSALFDFLILVARPAKDALGARHHLRIEFRIGDAAPLLADVVVERDEGELAQKQNGDKVDDGHERHEEVGEVPDEAERGNGAEIDHHHDDGAVDPQRGRMTADEVHVDFAVEV